MTYENAADHILRAHRHRIRVAVRLRFEMTNVNIAIKYISTSKHIPYSFDYKSHSNSARIRLVPAIFWIKRKIKVALE